MSDLQLACGRICPNNALSSLPFIMKYFITIGISEKNCITWRHLAQLIKKLNPSCYCLPSKISGKYYLQENGNFPTEFQI